MIESEGFAVRCFIKSVPFRRSRIGLIVRQRMSICTQMRRTPLGIAVGVPLDLVCQAPIRGQVSAAHDDILTGLSSSLGLYLAETLTLDHSAVGPPHKSAAGARAVAERMMAS